MRVRYAIFYSRSTRFLFCFYSVDPVHLVQKAVSNAPHWCAFSITIILHLFVQQDNLKALQARNRYEAKLERKDSEQEREQLIEGGENSAEVMLTKNRIDERENNKKWVKSIIVQLMIVLYVIFYRYWLVGCLDEIPPLIYGFPPILRFQDGWRKFKKIKNMSSKNIIEFFNKPDGVTNISQFRI